MLTFGAEYITAQNRVEYRKRMSDIYIKKINPADDPRVKTALEEKKIDHNFVDFIRKIGNPDPKERSNLDTLLQHNFLKKSKVD